MIVKQLDSENYNSYNYKLIVKDNIQTLFLQVAFLKSLFYVNLNSPILLISIKESMSNKIKPKKNMKIPSRDDGLRDYK